MKIAVMDIVGQIFRPGFIIRIVEVGVFHPLAQEILPGHLGPGDTIRVGVTPDGFHFELGRPAGMTGARTSRVPQLSARWALLQPQQGDMTPRSWRSQDVLGSDPCR